MSTQMRNKDLYSLGKQTFTDRVLVNSRTVVEKEGYVSTGILAHIEGEMMEIEMSEFKSFDLGNPVHLTIYSPVGIHRLQSTVIARAEGAIAIIFPPRALAGLEEKRLSPRVDTEQKGTLLWKISETRELPSGTETFEMDETIQFIIRNISFSGIGFMIEAGPRLTTDIIVEATIALESEFSCTLEIIRQESLGGQHFYGARFRNLDELQQRALRAFILREQIAVYYRQKQEKMARKQASQ